MKSWMEPASAQMSCMKDSIRNHGLKEQRKNIMKGGARQEAAIPQVAEGFSFPESFAFGLRSSCYSLHEPFVSYEPARHGPTHRHARARPHRAAAARGNRA